MTRVAAVDPGTLSFDLCVMQDGAVVLERTFAPADGALLDVLSAHGPYDLVYGPSGYGLPLVPAAEVGERELAEMVLVRADEAGRDTGIGGFRAMLRALVASGLPVVFGPGVVHLASVPAHRKANRIDMGTADKLCSAAWAIADQARRLRIDVASTSLVLLELGGAFSAALAVRDGAVVDGVGGSSGPRGARAAGALDGELAYLLGASLTKDTLFSGGALGAASLRDPAAAWADASLAAGWTALVESAVKAVLTMSASVPAPREIVVCGRLSVLPELIALLRASLRGVAPVRAGSARAAHGAAMLADGLCGGTYAPLVDAMRLRDASGSVLDHLTVTGAESIRLG